MRSLAHTVPSRLVIPFGVLTSVIKWSFNIGKLRGRNAPWEMHKWSISASGRLDRFRNRSTLKKELPFFFSSPACLDFYQSLPGATQFTLIPRGPTSFASDFVKPTRPALLAPYTVWPTFPRLPIILPEIENLIIYSCNVNYHLKLKVCIHRI